MLGPVPNTSLGIFLDSIQLTSILLCVIFISFRLSWINNKYIVQIKRSFFLFLLYIILVSFPLFLLSLKPLNQSTFLHLISSLRILITFFGVLALISLYKKEYGEFLFTPIVKNILIILFINAVIMIAQMFIPSVNIFLGNILYSNVDAIHFQDVQRMSGLFLSGGAIPSMYQGFGLLLLPYLFSVKNINFIKLVIGYLVLGISIIITGRSGLLFLPLSFILLLFSTQAKDIIKITLVSIVMIIIVFFSFSYFSNIAKSSNNADLVFNYNRLMNLFPNFNNGNSDDGTIGIILSKFTIPQNIVTFLLGDISFTNYTFFKVSDMGFDVSWYTYGVIGSVFFYLPIIIIIVQSFRFNLSKKPIKYLIRLFPLVYFCLEFKETFTYGRTGLSILLLIYFAGCILNKKQTSIKRKRLVATIVAAD